MGDLRRVTGREGVRDYGNGLGKGLVLVRGVVVGNMMMELVYGSTSKP